MKTTSGPATETAHRFAALDSWRGICALLVAATHFHIDTHVYSNAFLRHAGLFVDFFFVLSGFVIAHAYGTKLGSLQDLRSFALRRFGRLWPLHAAMLALFICSTLAKVLLNHLGLMQSRGPAFAGGTSAESIFTNLLMIQALGLHGRDTWNSPSWSISAEWCTYLLFALVSFLFLRRGRPLPSAVMLLLSAAACWIVFSFSGAFLETTHDFGFLRCVYGFFLGALVYRIWQKLAARRAVGGWIEWPTVVLVGAFVTVGTKELSMAAPLVFGAAVLVFAFERGSVSRLMKTGVPAALGRWSYSIYMTHAFLIHMIFLGMGIGSKRFGWNLMQDLQVFEVDGLVPSIVLSSRTLGDLGLVAYLLLVVGVSALTYRWIEQPGRSYFNRMASRRRQVAADAA